MSLIPSKTQLQPHWFPVGMKRDADDDLGWKKKTGLEEGTFDEDSWIEWKNVLLLMKKIQVSSSSKKELCLSNSRERQGWSGLEFVFLDSRGRISRSEREGGEWMQRIERETQIGFNDQYMLWLQGRLYHLSICTDSKKKPHLDLRPKLVLFLVPSSWLSLLLIEGWRFGWLKWAKAWGGGRIGKWAAPSSSVTLMAGWFDCWPTTTTSGEVLKEWGGVNVNPKNGRGDAGREAGEVILQSLAETLWLLTRFSSLIICKGFPVKGGEVWDALHEVITEPGHKTVPWIGEAWSEGGEDTQSDRNSVWSCCTETGCNDWCWGGGGEGQWLICTAFPSDLLLGL